MAETKYTTCAQCHQRLRFYERTEPICLDCVDANRRASQVPQ